MPSGEKTMSMKKNVKRKLLDWKTKQSKKKVGAWNNYWQKKIGTLQHTDSFTRNARLLEELQDADK
jgi:hypothetical protein